ncbi:LOW QUALITY PROTEIN: hypothetical protein MAR_032501, partial [Mya arenaria]
MPPKASGGVSVLVKSKLCDIYDVQIVDRSFDGIICLKVSHKSTGVDFVVFACYLSPENSPRGRDAQSKSPFTCTNIFNCDGMFIAADFNARIGNLSDILNDFDSIPALDSHQLHGLIGDASRHPDHSALIVEFETDYSNHCPTNETTPSKDRYNLKKIPADFMTSDLSRRAITNLIMTIDTTRENQTSIDTIYSDLCAIIINEMCLKLP